MIYHIFEHFQYLDFPGSGIMQYISVRSILASITAIVCSANSSGKRSATWVWRGSWPRRAPPRWAAYSSSVRYSSQYCCSET